MPLILILILLIGAPAFAVEEYYSISRSPRALGMGGAFYAFSDDEYALFYNPAGLSLYRGGAQFMVGLGGQLSHDAVDRVGTIARAFDGPGELSDIAAAIEELQGKPISAGAHGMVHFLMRGFGLAVLLAEPKANFALLGRSIDTELDVTAMNDTGVLMGFGGRIGSRLHVGVTGKFLYRVGGQRTFSVLDLATHETARFEDLGGGGAGVDFDIGATYEWKGKGTSSAGFSMALQNLAASRFTMSRVRGEPPGLVRSVSFGAFWEKRFRKGVNYVRLLADVAEIGLGGESDPDRGARTGTIWKHVNLGAEIPVFGMLFLRGGFHQGHWTAGLGLSLYLIKLDIANYAEELSLGSDRLASRRWMARLAIGFGAPRATSTSPNSPRRR